MNEIKEKTNKFKRNSLIAFGMAFVLLLGSSVAYFTDYVATSTSGTAGTVDISFDDNINLLNADGKDILNPGDIRDVKFSVKNEGNKSTDMEVVVTLTSSVPMENNSNFHGGKSTKSIMPLVDFGDDTGNPDEADENLYYQNVYGSEYELYSAEDVVEVEGYGHYPKYGTKPVQERYMNGAQTQIVYVLDVDVLSGSSDLDEQEVEYVLTSDVGPLTDYYILAEEQEYHYDYGDFSDIVPGETECCYMQVILPTSSEFETIIFPNYKLAENGQKIHAEYILFYGAPSEGVGFPAEATDIYIGSAVKELILFDVENNETIRYTKEEFETTFDVKIHQYDEIEDVINGSNVDSAISAFEYEQLSDDMKACYTKCEDSKIYDFVLLFDPNSGNKMQGSNVSLKIEVRAKQHRNTEAGWELVSESLNSVIQDSDFTVEYDEMRRVELTGIKDDVDLSSMTEITIPEGVEIIPVGFFEGYTNIQVVNLPTTLKEIQNRAFSDCTGLTTINFPDDLEYIGEMAFYGCEKLSDITLPSNSMKIETLAFSQCKSLKSITVPGSVELVGDTFSYTGLETVVIEEGVQEIPSFTFEGCANLKSITLPDSVKEIGTFVFHDCTALTNIDLPENLNKISYSAFKGCTSLESIVLPDSITQVGGYAFSDCTNLENVTFGDNIGWIDTYAFYNSGITSVVIDDGLETVGSYAFAECSDLKTVVLPDKVGVINKRVFENCTSLVDVTLPKNITEIRDGTFKGCTALTEIVIPDKVTIINQYAFQDCDNLTKITIPDGITMIGVKAFNCSITGVETTVYTNNSKALSYNWSAAGRNVTFVEN